jgi:hypothetical protein
VIEHIEDVIPVFVFLPPSRAYWREVNVTVATPFFFVIIKVTEQPVHVIVVGAAVKTICLSTGKDAVESPEVLDRRR